MDWFWLFIAVSALIALFPFMAAISSDPPTTHTRKPE